MPIAPPTPMPQLDGPPPSPESAGAGPSPVSMEGLAPATGTDSVGALQVVQLTLQTAQAVAQGLDVLGQMNPALVGLAAHLQLMLKEGVRKALQQGAPGSEPAPSASFSGMGGMA